MDFSYCTSTEKFPYIYITKDNVEQFVDKYGVNAEHTIKYIDNTVKVKYKNSTWSFSLNTYAVDVTGMYDWSFLTPEQFDEEYRTEPDSEIYAYSNGDGTYNAVIKQHGITIMQNGKPICKRI